MTPVTERTNTRRREPGSERSGVTLVELLVVISIIGVLMGLLFPALHAARETSRQAACQSNLKQFATGILSHASNHRTVCSGAFDWHQDGCVTEVGWVADLMDRGIPVGRMLCTSNPHRISETYNDLLTLDATALDDCVDRLGSPAEMDPQGNPICNPCRAIAEIPLEPNSEQRRSHVEREIYEEDYNTNYTASWFLVRTGVSLGPDGGLRQTKSPSGQPCEKSLKAHGSFVGPLTFGRADCAALPLTAIPLLGDGGPSGILVQQIGPVPEGSMVVKSFTNGPVLPESMEAPSPPGETDWEATLQDYRHFAPVHRGACNILFADGSVRTFVDRNKDSLLNNGFPATEVTGFKSPDVEVSDKELFSGWTLRRRR